jgi:seipin
MYNFRLTSFVVLTSIFWMVELSATAIVWFSLTSYLASGSKSDFAVKKEDESATKQEPSIKDENELSDTPHTFPTLSGLPPLRYSSPQVKEEEREELPAEHRTVHGEQADDEDEDADYVRDDIGGRGFTDSGIGTSMESSAGGPRSVRRRRSQLDRD